MRKKLRRILTVITVAVVALLVAVIATLSSLDYNAYRDAIAAEIERATGREVKIAGELQLALGFRPSLDVTDVSFANAAGGTRPEMVTLERLEAKLALWPLLSGDIDIDRLVLVGADVLLETDKAGVGNWVFGDTGQASPSGPTKPIVPAATEIRIERSALTYIAGKRRHQVRIDSFTAETGSGATPLDVSVAGAVDGTNLTLNGAVGALARLRDGRPYPVDVILALSGIEVAVTGVIARPLQGRGLDLALRASVPELAALSPLAGSALPKLAPIKASVNLTDQEGAYQLRSLKLTLADSDLAGDLTLTLGERPRLTGTLRSDRLVVENLSPPRRGAEQGDGRVFPDDPLPVAGLGLLDADLDYQAAEMLFVQTSLRDLGARLKLEHGRLSLDPVTALLAGGKLAGAAALDASKTPPRLSFDVALSGAELARLSGDADSTVLRGRLDLKLKGAGSGQSLRQVAAGLDGRANGVIVDGYIAKGYVDLLAADLLRSLAPGGGDVAGSKVNCFVADLPVDKGLAKVRVLLLDTERMTMTGEGAIDLASERLKLHLKPKPKDASLLSLATPVNVGGTLAEPTVLPDAVGLASGAAGAVVGNLLLPGAGLLLPLLSPGSGEKHPCLRAVGAEAAAPPPDKKGGGIGGLLKGLGDKIDKTLGVDK